jgi:hypothetical protein
MAAISRDTEHTHAPFEQLALLVLPRQIWEVKRRHFSKVSGILQERGY